MHRKHLSLAAAGVLLAIAAVGAISASAGSAKPDARIVFGSDRADGQRDLYIVNEDGTGEHRLTFDGNDMFERVASWSPDNSRIAYAANHNGNFDIYTIDPNGGTPQRITTDPARDDYPEWTSDGRIVFTRGLFNCPCAEWIVNADGTNAQQLPLRGSVVSAEPSLTSNRIVYASADSSSITALHVSTLTGGGDKQITNPPSDGEGDFEPHWSPNGNDIVFLRDHGGVDNDVFVVHADGSGLRRITNTPDRPEFWATWSSDGSEIIYQDGTTGKLHAVSVSSGQDRLLATSPRAPFTETFDGTQRDSSLWHQINDPGGTVSQSGGRLVTSIDGTAVPGGQYNQVDEHYGMQCQVSGDFDVRVDYSLLQWPHDGGFRANLSAFFANASLGRASVLVPWAPSWNDEQVQGYSDGGNGSFASSDASGTFRLVRQAGIVTGYVAQGSDWRPVFSGAATVSAVLGVGLSAQASDFGHRSGSVAFDNFQLASGDLSCPDWWHDAFPDVSNG
jgi:Tol biopolymer transport system component